MFSKICLCLLLFFQPGPLKSQPSLKEQLESAVSGKKATVGIAVLYDGQTLTTVNDHISYPMMSTFKFPVGLAVLHYLNEQMLPLDTAILISASDLKPNTYSPLRKARPKGNFQMTIRDLLIYTIAQSDNNACDILIRFAGGTKQIQNYLDHLGIRNMQITATEDDMHQNNGNPYLNHSRPSSAVYLIEKFLQEELFPPASREFLIKTMQETTTGPDKLKGLLPENTKIGHKTGSSDRNAAGMKAGDNDIGFVFLPNGKHYTIAVFVMDSMEDDQTNAAIIARISRIVYDYYNTSSPE